MKLGLSHDVYLDIPSDVTVKCPNNSTITLRGNQKIFYLNLLLRFEVTDYQNPIKVKVFYLKMKLLEENKEKLILSFMKSNYKNNKKKIKVTIKNLLQMIFILRRSS